MFDFDEESSGSFEEPEEPREPEPAAKPRTSMGGGAVLAAAMLAIGDILEPDKAGVEIAEQADDDSGPDFGLDFGDLPPLD